MSLLHTFNDTAIGKSKESLTSTRVISQDRHKLCGRKGNLVYAVICPEGIIIPHAY